MHKRRFVLALAAGGAAFALAGCTPAVMSAKDRELAEDYIDVYALGSADNAIGGGGGWADGQEATVSLGLASGPVSSLWATCYGDGVVTLRIWINDVELDAPFEVSCGSEMVDLALNRAEVSTIRVSAMRETLPTTWWFEIH